MPLGPKTKEAVRVRRGSRAVWPLHDIVIPNTVWCLADDYDARAKDQGGRTSREGACGEGVDGFAPPRGMPPPRYLVACVSGTLEYRVATMGYGSPLLGSVAARLLIMLTDGFTPPVACAPRDI